MRQPSAARPASFPILASRSERRVRRGVHRAGDRAREAGQRPGVPQPHGRRRRGLGRRDRRRGVPRGAGPAARRDHGAQPGRRTRPRRHALHLPRTLRSLRPHAPVHGGDRARRHRAGGLGDPGPEPGRRRAGDPDPPRPRRRGARGDPGRRGGSAERGVRQARADRDAVRDLEGGRLARRQGRGARRLLPVDHRRGRAGRRPSAPSLGGRDRGGGGHGARRRPRAHGPRSRLPGAAADPRPGGRARAGGSLG